ncbi:WXG100-like domain-containing protein [Nocardia sp. R16R-3T]
MAELPGYLKWLEWVAGSDWPAGDPDGMWGVAEDWRTAAAGLRDIMPDIRAAKTASLKAYPDGDGIKAVLANFDSYLEGPQSLEMLARDFEKLADSATSVGSEIEYGQLMLITSLALLAAEIAIAWIFPPTAPAEEALAIAGTRVAIRMIAKQVMDKIVEIVAKFLGRRLANFLVRHIAIDTALGTVQDWGIQQYQVSTGHRKEVNWEQVGITAISSAVGAGVASPIGERLGEKLADTEMKAWLRGLLTGATAGTAGALAGFGGSVGAQFAFTWASSGPEGGWDKAVEGLKKTEFDLRMLTAGASNGAMSGANRAMADQFYQGRHPEWYRPNGPTVNPDSLSRIGFRPDVGPVGAGDGADAGRAGAAGSAAGQTGAGAPNAGHTGESATGRSGANGAADGATAHVVDSGAAAGADGSSNSHGAGDDSAHRHGADDGMSKAGAADGSTGRAGDDGATAHAGDGGATAHAGADSSTTARADADASTNTQRAGDGTTDWRAADGGVDQSSMRNSEAGTVSEGSVRPAAESGQNPNLAVAQANSTVDSNGAGDRTGSADYTGASAHEGPTRPDAGTRADLTPAGAQHTSSATDGSRISNDNAATRTGAAAASGSLQTGAAPTQTGTTATHTAPDTRTGTTPSAPRTASTADMRPGANPITETARGEQPRPQSATEPRTTTPSTAETRTTTDGRGGTDRFRTGNTNSDAEPTRTAPENRAGAAQTTLHPTADPMAGPQAAPAPIHAEAQADSNATVRPSDPAAPPDSADAARPDGDTSVRPDSADAAHSDNDTAARPDNDSAAHSDSDIAAHPDNTTAQRRGGSDATPSVRPESDIPDADRVVRPETAAPVRTNDVARDSGGAADPRSDGAVRPDGGDIARSQAESATRPDGDGTASRDVGAARNEGADVVRESDSVVRPDGATRHESDGRVRPDGDGVARRDGDRAVRPVGADVVRPDDDRAVRPEGDGVARPDTERVVRAAGDTAVRPDGERVVRPGGDDAARLGNESVVRARDEGAIRSGDEGIARPDDEGTVHLADQDTARSADEGAVRADDIPPRPKASDVRHATDPATQVGAHRAGADVEAAAESHRDAGEVARREEVEQRREAARRRAESHDPAVAFVPQPEPHVQRATGDGPADRPRDGDGADAQQRRGGDEVRIPERNRGRCAELSLRLIKALTGSSAIRLPERVIGLDGMTAAEVQAAAGGQLRSYGDHAEIARLLLSRPEGASALVVDEYSGAVDRYNVGAHAYVMVHENGGIVVRDPGAGRVEGFPPTVPRELRGTYAIAFDPAGKPLHPIGSEHPHASDPAVRIGRSLDAQPDQVRELLRQTETGRQIAASFDNSPVRDGFEPSAGDGRAGEFRRRELTAVAFTSGVDHVHQALTLAHESVHAERYVQGETGDARAMVRDVFVRTMVGEEAAATGRRFQLAQEFRDLEYDIAVHPLEQTYTTAYDRAAADLSASDSSLTPAEIRQAAHEVAVDALHKAIATYEWRNGKNYTDHYGDFWDRVKTASAELPPGARMHDTTADIAENLRTGALARESALRDLRDTSAELVRRAAALDLDPTLATEPLQRHITDRLQRISDERAGMDVPPERQAELRTEEHELRTLADLADQRQQAQASYDHRADQVANAAIRDVLAQQLRENPSARMLNENIMHIPGEPDRLVIASGTDDHQRVLREAQRNPEIRDLLDRPEVVREHLNVDADQVGRIRVEPIAEPSPRQFDRATDLTPLDRAGAAARERIARIRKQLRETTEIGSWADAMLTRHNVDIVYEAGSDDRYYPSRRTLVLDVGASDAAQMVALVHGASHVELAQTRESPGGAQERMGLSHADYIASMVREEARAHAKEIIAAKQLRAARHDLAETALERTYTAAYDEARARAHEQNPAAPASELDRIAEQAGQDAIGRELAGHRPGHSTETHAEFYGHAWDDAHGIRSFDDIVRSAIASGERSVTVLSEGSSVHAARKVELVTFNDGTELIRKTVISSRHAVAERLASLLGRAIGANVPEVFHDKSADANVVYMEKMAGRVAAERHPQFVDVHELGYADTVAGRALGLLDALIRIPDRDGQGWMIGSQREVIGIDHSRGFEDSVDARNALSPFAEHFLRRNGDSIEVIDHQLPRSVVDAIIERVAALRPEFDKDGRGQWHDTVMARLTEIREHASDSSPEHGDMAMRPEDSNRHDEEFDDRPNAYTNRYGGDNQHGIHGRVDADGVLHVTVRVGDGTPTGREMFRDMMRELGHQVTEIRAEWNADDRPGGGPEPDAGAWQVRPRDMTGAPVWELLGRSETGREVAEVLRSARAAVRFEDTAGHRDSFNGRTMDVSVDSHDRSQPAQAEAVVRAAALADAVLSGRVEVDPARIRAMERSDYVAAQIRTDAEALGRQAEFRRELAAAGYPESAPTAHDVADSAYTRALHEQYLTARDAAIAAADPGLGEHESRRIGREAGIEALLSSDMFDSPLYPSEGASLRDIHGGTWDAHQRPDGMYEPTSAESARELQRLVREHAALTRELWAVEGDWDRAVRRFGAFDPETHRGDRDLFERGRQAVAEDRIRPVGRGMNSERPVQVRALDEATRRYVEVEAQRNRVLDEIAARVGQQVLGPEVLAEQGHWANDRVAVLPGEPPRVIVVDGRGDHVAISRAAADRGSELHRAISYGDATAQRLHVSVDDSGAVQVRREPVDLRTAWVDAAAADVRAEVEHQVAPRPPDEPAAASPEFDQSMGETAQVASDRLQRILRGNELGRWAAEVLARHGVAIRFGLDVDSGLYDGRQQRGVDAGYDPASNTVLLGLTDAPSQHAAEAIRAAYLAEQLGAPNGVLERFTLGRDEYVDLMLDREAVAQARAFEFDRWRQFGTESTPAPETLLSKVYKDAFKQAQLQAERAYRDNRGITGSMIDTAAHHSAAREVRNRLVELGSRVDGGDLAAFYRAQWDSAHAITRAPGEGPPVHHTDTPAMREQRSRQYAAEIESLRMLRDSGRFVPVGPAERAYADAYDRAYQRAERTAARSNDPAIRPERAGYEAGREALRNYIDKVGLEAAEVAFDVARHADDNLDDYRPWSDTAEPETGHPADQDASPPRISAQDAADRINRFFDDELARDPGGTRLTDRVAQFPGHQPVGRGRLVVAAPADEHMDALRDLAATHPEYTDVLWDDTHRIEYLEVGQRPDGSLSADWIYAGIAEGPYRLPGADEQATEMLAHYLRYRAAGQTDLGFDTWIRQLGPDAFEIGDGTSSSRKDKLRAGFISRGYELAEADPSIGEPHPAEVARRLRTRQVAMPEYNNAAANSARERSWPQFLRTEVKTRAWDFGVMLQSDGNGGWRVAPPVGDGSASDVVARQFQGMSDSDSGRLGERISRILLDGSADLNDHSASKGLLRRITDKLPFGNRSGQGDSAPRPIDRPRPGDDSFDAPEFPPADPDDGAQDRRAQQQRQDLLDRLAAENAAAVRERDEARAAGDPERIAQAEERVARADEAMAIALQRDALLRAGAIPVTDRVGVVPGEPARVFVVGWGDGDPVRVLDAATAQHPRLAELRAEPGTVVRELRIGPSGETRVLRVDDPAAPQQSRAEVERPAQAEVERPAQAGGGGGGKKPPSEPPVAAGTPEDPDHSRNENSGSGSEDPSNRDESRRIVIDANGEEVPLQVRPDDEGRWRVEAPEESEPPAHPADSEPPEKKSPLRRAWERIRQRMRVRGYVGDYPKYPSGSGEDRRGQNAVKDGIEHAPDLLESHPQAPHPPPATPGHETVARPAPESGGEGLNMARIAKEGWTAWRNREHLPILNKLSGRIRDVAGDFVVPRTADGEEYRFWVSDADPDLVRQTVTELLEVEAIAPQEARAVLEEALAVADPQQRQRIIDDLENFGLISDEEARALEHEPAPAEPSSEIDAAPPEDESLTDMAHRLGFDLPDDSPETIRRVLDEQEYRTMREAAAIAGLAEAADRFNEELTRPYVNADLSGNSGPELRGREPVAGEIEDPDARRVDEDSYDEDEPARASGPRWGVPDATGRPVPLADQVSIFDDNPMGRFLRELISAFDGHPGLQNFRPVGNGADPLREFGDIGDGQELGRDQGPRVYFEHALRRDQLRDEASTWAQMFGLDLNDVNPRNLDVALRRLWAENDARAARVAEFAEAAEPHLRAAQQEPVGEIHGDQVARVPVGDDAPDRLVVINGPLDRADALARALADDPALADALDRGEVELDYRSARTDRMGQIHLDPVETPEVYHHRETIDGRELVVTMVRDNDGRWRAVQAPVEEPTTHSPGEQGDTPPRTRAEMLSEIVDLAKELGLGPEALHPDRLARTIAELKLANALRAGQVEALADFARTMNAIENFNDIGNARGQLADRVDIPESELTPRRVAQALADPEWRPSRREQQFDDLANYAEQLRDSDLGAVNAARDRLAAQLGLSNSESLQPIKVRVADDGRVIRGLDADKLDPAKLRKVIARLEGEGKRDQVVDALTEYVRALIDIDVYSDVPRGDLSADPRAAGEPPIHELACVRALREIIAEAMQSGDALDFGRVLADHAGRADGASGEGRGRPEPNRDWARLVGVDIAGADDVTFRKVYEAYRDGKIEKHEGLSPSELTAELGRLRAEIQTRAEQIRNLAALVDEFYTAPDELTAPRPGADHALRVGGPDDGGPGPKPAGPDDPGSVDPPDRPGSEPDSRSDWKRRMDAEQDEWNARMHAELDEWVARMRAEQGASVDNSDHPTARIDNAFQRESAAAEEAFRRRDEEAEAQHQGVMDRLDERMRRLEERFGDIDNSQEGVPDSAESPIDNALARESTAAEEAFRRRDAEAEAEHQALMDRLDELVDRLQERFADPQEAVPEPDSAEPRRLDGGSQEPPRSDDGPDEDGPEPAGSPSGPLHDPPDSPASGTKPIPVRDEADGARGTNTVGGGAKSSADPTAHPLSQTQSRPIVDEWSKRSPRQVAKVLARRHSIEVEGFRRKGIDPEVVREIARAVDEMLTKHPEMKLAGVRIEPGDPRHPQGGVAYTSTSPRVGADAPLAERLRQVTPSIVVLEESARGQSWGSDEDTLVSKTSRDGTRVIGADRPVYGVLVHELGHVLDYAGQGRAQRRVMDALREHYLATREHPGETDFRAWVDQLTRYSFDGDNLDPGEALSDAFGEVERYGDDASEPAQVLYRLLVDEARAGASSAVEYVNRAPSVPVELWPGGSGDVSHHISESPSEPPPAEAGKRPDAARTDEPVVVRIDDDPDGVESALPEKAAPDESIEPVAEAGGGSQKPPADPPAPPMSEPEEPSPGGADGGAKDRRPAGAPDAAEGGAGPGAEVRVEGPSGRNSADGVENRQPAGTPDEPGEPTDPVQRIEQAHQRAESGFDELQRRIDAWHEAALRDEQGDSAPLRYSGAVGSAQEAGHSGAPEADGAGGSQHPPQEPPGSAQLEPEEPSSGGWPQDGPSRVHEPVTPELRDALPGLAARIAETAATRQAMEPGIAEGARRLGIDPDGASPHEIQRAVNDLVAAAQDRVAEIRDREHVPSHEMVQHFEDLRAAERHATEVRDAASAYQAELSRYLQAMNDENMARQRAAVLAARDVLAGEQAHMVAEGVGIAPGGQRVVVASPSSAPEQVMPAELRHQLGDQGVHVDYLHVVVDESGVVTVTPIRPPEEGTAPARPTGPPETPGSGSTPTERFAAQQDQRGSHETPRTDVGGSDPTRSASHVRGADADASDRSRSVPATQGADANDSDPTHSTSENRGADGSQPDSGTTAPHSDGLTPEVRAELDRLRAERAEAVADREELRDLRRLRAAGLPVDVEEGLRPGRPLEMTLEELRNQTMLVHEQAERHARIDALERAANEFNRAEAEVVRLDEAIAMLELSGTPEAVHAALVRERAAMAAECEFWRAKRNDRAERFDIRDPDHALNQDNLEPTLRRLSDDIVGTRDIAGAGDETSRSEPELVGAAERTQRENSIFKLQDAAERFNEADSALVELDRRIAALEVVDVIAHRPLSAETRAELDRLGAERATEVLASKPWRGMCDDLADRLGVNRDALGPEEIDETLREAANRLAPTEENTRLLDLLREAADRVNQADNSIGRVQGQMAELAGACRDVFAAEGAKQITDRVGLVEGEHPRIIVVAPRGTLEHPRAGHDAALGDAIRRNSAVAEAMTRRETQIEYRVIIAEREMPMRTGELERPRREYLIAGWRGMDVPREDVPDVPGQRLTRWRHGVPRLRLTRWEDGNGDWHPVDPARPDWTIDRRGPRVPKAFEPRVLPEGVSGWAVDPFQSSIVDPFLDPPPGAIDKELLPRIPGMDPLDPGVPTFEPPMAGVFYNTMRIILESAKLSGFTWYSDKDHPGRISPGFKGHPYFRPRAADVQPMAREWNPQDRVPDRGELSEEYKQRQRDQEAAWARVQHWADTEYERFRPDDSDIDRIVDHLATHPDAEGAARAVRAAEIVDQIARRLDSSGDLAPIADALTGHLRDEQRGDATRLVDDIRDRLGNRGADRAELTGLVADRLDNSTSAFTHAEIEQIKNHLMRDPHLVHDPNDGILRRRPLDAVADVAEAWNRLIAGNPLPQDILLLQDALAESNYQRHNPVAAWHDANQHAIRIGFDWNANRPPRTDWRTKIPYAPPRVDHQPQLPARVLPTPDSPRALPPNPNEPPAPTNDHPLQKPPSPSGGTEPPSTTDAPAVRAEPEPAEPSTADERPTPDAGTQRGDEPPNTLGSRDPADSSDAVGDRDGESPGADVPPVREGAELGEPRGESDDPGPRHGQNLLESAGRRDSASDESSDSTVRRDGDESSDGVMPGDRSGDLEPSDGSVRPGSVDGESFDESTHPGAGGNEESPEERGRVREGETSGDASHPRAGEGKSAGDAASRGRDGGEGGARANRGGQQPPDGRSSSGGSEPPPLPGSMLRSHIPHPPRLNHEYEMPDQPSRAPFDPTWPLPEQPPEPPTPPHPPTPPVPPHQPVLPKPPVPPHQPVPPKPPVPPHQPMPPKPPVSPKPPFPPTPPVPPFPPTPPVPPFPPTPPVPPVPPTPPVPPVPSLPPTPPVPPVPPVPPFPPPTPEPPRPPITPVPPFPPITPEPPFPSTPPEPPQPPVTPVPPSPPTTPASPVPPAMPVLPTTPQPPLPPATPVPPGPPTMPEPSQPPALPPHDSITPPHDRTHSPSFGYPSDPPTRPGTPVPSSPPDQHHSGTPLPPGWRDASHQSVNPAAPQQDSTPQNTPPPMTLPPVGAPPATARNRQGANAYRNRPSQNGNSTTLFVQPFSGFGVPARFDPETGALQAVGAGIGPQLGVYGDLGDTPVVFYRDTSGLALRIGDNTIHLDTPLVAIEWEPVENRQTRFAVTASGTVVCQLRYRSLPPELDLGRLIHDVCATPTRRTQIFTR